MTRTLLRTVGSVAIALTTLLPFVGCKTKDNGPAFGTSEVKVAVSFPALYSLAANVVGDTGTVKSVKSTQGAHGSEVTKTEMDVIASADLLFANGMGLDDEFTKKLREGSNNPGIKVVYLGNQLKHKYLLESDGCACCKEEEGKEKGGHDHDHDPHVWMGLDRAVLFVDFICTALSDKYPQHKATFRTNADTYKVKLKAIKEEGTKELAGWKEDDRKIVTAHGSMAYFADTFKIEVVDTIQKTVGKEPTKKQLDELIEKCQMEGVRVIAAEPQFSKLGGVKTLADELSRKGTKVSVIELDNLETATSAELTPGWYEAKMRANIAALKDAVK
ncbi:MAG: metal ABC transporter substrate-binding protein [Fimbriiglobus sp.]|jgi:ABC-type Zn uptake system ZnuABC Zn-binding protein ZnuA|nr:metal ABC transporter substrate-binding protein [Fimbriiglobus sp.]